MFGWFKKKGELPGGDGTLSAIENKLVAIVPQRVKSLGITRPVYCLRIWYYGTDSAGNRVPSLMLCTDARRREALAKRGESAPHYLWCADELSGGDFNADVRDSSVTALCHRWYARPSGKQTEEEELLPMRQMVQRVAKRLNCLSWKEYIPVTDDFVVFPADASHTFCADYDEMVASVPADRIELLRSRKMLGTRYWYTFSTESEDDL